MGPCAKQLVIAILVNGNRHWVGSNWCDKPQETCPRGDLPSGEGYEMCKNVCLQPYHAEEDACRQAGTAARGGTMYIMGHTYCCDHCLQIMDNYGVDEVMILETEDMFTPKGE